MKELSLISIIIFVFLLQGCVAAAIFSTAAVGTKAVIDPRTIGTQVDDSILELRINRALSKDEPIKRNTRINVAVYQDKVLLIGQAPNSYLAARAHRIAMNVDGVTEVFNEVRMGKPISLITMSSDTWITTKVRCSLQLSSEQMKLSNIKVITENGEVFLLGLVTEYEGKIAANIASRVSGVKQVTTAFTYVK